MRCGSVCRRESRSGGRGPRGANPEILRRVLRCVAATGLLRSAGPHRYELTDACRAVMDEWAFAGFRFNADPEIWNMEQVVVLRSGRCVSEFC